MVTGASAGAIAWSVEPPRQSPRQPAGVAPGPAGGAPQRFPVVWQAPPARLHAIIPAGGLTIRTIYAAQFQVEPPGGDAAALELKVGALAEEWISRFYLDRISLPLGGGEVGPQQGHSIVVAAAPPDGSHRHWSLRWRRETSAQPVGWEAELTLAQAGSVAELSCLVRDASPGKPSNTALRRPGVVRDAVQELDCSAGGLPLRALAGPLAAADVPAFVEAGLCSPERALPVLVISRDGPGYDPRVEPSVLVDRLVGLAHLVLLDDEWAAFALADVVGKDRACENGELRLYLPGFSLGAEPSAHPRYVPAPAGTRGRPVSLPELILQRLAADAVAGFRPGSITRAAREALGVPELVPPARSRAPRRPAPPGAPLAPAEAPQPDHALLDRLVLENEALGRRNAELEHQTFELEVALEEARIALDAAELRLEAERLALASRPPDILAQAGEEPELACVLDAVALAKVRFAERLFFLASAESSAAASPFQNARRAFEALKAVDEVAQLRRASIQDRTSVGAMETLFQNRGFLYKAHESMTARGRWGEEYQVVFEGRKESIEEHVAIGTGGPESCLRIHFFWDAPSMRFVVAHVGRHKTNTKS